MARAALVALALAGYFAYLRTEHVLATAAVHQLQTLYTTPATQLAEFSTPNR